MRFLPTVLVLAASAALAIPSPSFAQGRSRQAEAQVERLLREAREAYDNLELDVAEQSLDRAIRLGEDNRLATPRLAEAYIQRGILYHVRDKDTERAVADFISALQIDDRAQLDPLVSTPSLEKLFDEARASARRAPARRDDPPPRGREPVDRDPPPQRGGGQDLYHEPPAKAKAGESLPLSVEVDDRINRVVYRVQLVFTTARSRQAQKVEMEPQGQRSFLARIPRRFVVGTTLSYYIVAEDRQGRPVGQVGSTERPILIPIEGDVLGGVDEIASGSSLDGLGGGGGREYLSLTLSVGTGGGVITDRAEPQNQTGFRVSPGFALAPFHTLIELDVWATEWLAIGGYARVQIVEFAHLEGGRVKVRVLEAGASQLHARVGGGYGFVRHLVDLGELLDTTLEGPFHWTLGVSWKYAFTPLMSLVVSPDFYHLIGDSPSYHFDLNVGVSFDF
ncbi:MAG: hypothetical protein R3F65_02280 [bacterium]|nr:hypothetical protein [Myxococcales bacterium]MCB9543072.1 hypothetical protein [Myxococcales bacterium]MCB9551606.1 hypothetical protein [Myxococcales bacterium]